MFRSLIPLAAISIACAPALAESNLPPFDFSDSFYLANGIDPTTLIGRPTGAPPNSIIDNRENGPNLNNVRLLQQAAAYDHSGHPIFFYVTGLPTDASFTNNAAGQNARQVAETYQVYEFPRAANGQFAVFPKRQDLIADLRNGYFSNNPLGVWRINIIKFTPAALNTPAGQQALTELRQRNGTDIDGTPIIKTVSEVESLLAAGFVTNEIPPANTPGVFRWFFCPVVEDPRDGAIAPDAHLDVTESSDAKMFRNLFKCLKLTGRECECYANCDGSGSQPTLTANDFQCFLNAYASGSSYANCDESTAEPRLTANDFLCFMNQVVSRCP